MSYLTEQKTQLRAAQVTEALLRMKKLNLHEEVIQEFLREGKVNRSESDMGILFWLDETEEKMVRDWEEETGNVVYHVIKKPMVFGLCYALLYVSTHTEEWELDNEDAEAGSPFVYVFNADDPDCSEYGSIGIIKRFGGLVRIW